MQSSYVPARCTKVFPARVPNYARDTMHRRGGDAGCQWRLAPILKSGMYALAGIVGLVGLVFLIGNQGLPARMIIGIVLIAAGVVIGWLTSMKAPERTIVQKIDVTGDVKTEQLECRNCGAPLDEKSISMQEGAIIVKCPYCGASYHIEEAPKW